MRTIYYFFIFQITTFSLSCTSDTSIEERIINDIKDVLIEDVRGEVLPPLNFDQRVTLVFSDSLQKMSPASIDNSKNIQEMEVDSIQYLILLNFWQNSINSKYLNVNNIADTDNTIVICEDELGGHNSSVGVITLSTFYFSYDKNHVGFYFDYFCGGECGFGKFVFAEIIEKKWRVTKIIFLSVS